MNNPSPSPRKATEENIAKLKEKLRELFQLDRGDLDFGLYRIMAHKRAEVDKFLENRLLPQVTEALGTIAEADSETANQKLDKVLALARQLGGIDPEQTDAAKDARAELAAAKSDEQIEADTYNHLYNFFSRYYDEGDFMSLRRYKGEGKEAYSIPYNGEEVKLHWANSDQYYIKTTENYASYIFTVGADKPKRRVRFEMAAADNEKDNIKEVNGKQRFFILAKDFIAEDKKANDLIIRFEHRPLTEGEKKKHPQNGIKRQASINGETEQRIRAKLNGDWSNLLLATCPTEADEARTVLGKHLTAYTAKNSFDYFIHKDLGGFLRRELDFYIKSEVISVDNLTLADDPGVFIRGLAQIKAIKHVGEKIIDFLAQLEDFQKQLWLKKKFVLETQYCVTLDKVPESLYPVIAKNKNQRDEWVKLFAIDKLNGDRVDGSTAYSKPLKPEFLKENPYLVLDTRHFDRGFKDKLLAALSEAGPIEEQMNGLLVHGENFQALNLLQERYREQVKCVYIDPPYNTDTSAILYKNNYKHSSWMAFMENRLIAGKTFLTTNGSQVVAIDDTEFVVLTQVLDQLFSEYDRNVVVVNHHPAGAGLEGTNISETHEYALFMTPLGEKVLFGEPKNGESSEILFLRTGTAESNLRIGRPNSFYCVLIDPKESRVVGLEPPPTDNYPKGNTDEGFIRVYPVSSDGTERVWRRSYESCLNEISEGNLICKNGKHLYIKSKNNGKHRPIFSNWTDKKYNAGAHGTKVLNNVIGDNLFSYPKSIHTVRDCVSHITRIDSHPLVLDYFAGSGTTGHAVISLNREDDGDRKYILVEIGNYFEDVLLPRMKKVIYAEKWKDGKPEDRKGVSQLLRYIRLESYEDALDSLTLKIRGDMFDNEDYQLRYALGDETTENATLLGKDFINPHDYTLSVVRDGVRRDMPVDLAETFNSLLGLRLTGRRQIDDVLTIQGTNPKGKNCLILWRNLKKMNASKLEQWFAKHRAKFGGDLNLIYINGDHTLNALRQAGDKWEVVTLEPVFKELMFGESA